MRRQVRVLVALAALARGTASGDEPAQVENAAWRVRARVIRPSAPGSRFRLEITLETLGTYHLNDDYPLHFDTKPALGIEFPRARIDRKDGVTLGPCKEGGHACRALVPVAFTATAAATLVGGMLSFSACDDERCLIEKIAVSAPVVTR